MRFDVLVIGAGPAGLTAGLYVSRAGWRAACLERLAPGGQAALTSRVDNYPGFDEPVSGFELCRRMEAQAKRFGVEVVQGEAQGLAVAAGSVVVRSAEATLRADAVVVASGARPRELGVPGETELRGKGVSYCATCDGPFFRNQAVAVVGGGDSAVEEAMFLARLCSRVYLVHRRDEFRAVKTVVERALNDTKIVPVQSAVVTRIAGTDGVEAVEVRNVSTGATDRLEVAGVFVYVGLLPNSEFLAGQVARDGAGYVITDEDMLTSAPGVFAAGDVRKKSLRQISTAVGDGAIAAMSAVRHLQGLRAQSR
ncbi:MAG: thioredoxin-disulfide reductase [Candidatus Eisenbacteria bacterium]|nr:thioredoxin-disulfide reductase [Candidatus Eisenbacteria bacterium]